MKIERLFDLLPNYQQKFNKQNMLAAVEDGVWQHTSTNQFIEQINTLSCALLNLGVKANNFMPESMDKVGIISKNRPEWHVLDFACQQIGVVLCPIYPTTNPAELTYIINDAQIKYMFTSGEDLWNKVSSIKSSCPSLQQIFSFDDIEGATFWKTILSPNSEELLPQVEAIKQIITPQTLATIIYTSGTTGKPKGVMLSHHNIVTNVKNAVASFPFDDSPQKKALSFLPLNHIFERMISYLYLYCGLSIYYVGNLDTVGDDIRSAQPNMFATVPRLLEKIYDKILEKGSHLTGIKKKLFDWSIKLAEAYDTERNMSKRYLFKRKIADKLIYKKWREALGGNLEIMISGGAACSIKILRVFNAAGFKLREGYGPTENSPVITVSNYDENRVRFGYVGPCIPGQTLKIADDGEICVKGPSVMMGYYKLPELTAQTVVDGWLLTGDIGSLDETGLLKITDRKKELFKTSGGKYVAPQPIENSLKESIFVEQVMAVGENEKFVGALIVPHFTGLKEWMQKNGLNFISNEDAIQQPQVLQLYEQAVQTSNKKFNQVEQVKKFELLPTEWTIESGELTPTLKLKRKVIMEKQKYYIDKMYHTSA